MEAVASRAGVSKATVYRRYRDKDEVVAATILATTDPPPPGVPFPGGSARQNLTAILKMAGVAMSNPAWPAILRAMLSDHHGSGGLLPTVSRQVIEPGVEAVRSLVDFGVANGELRPSVTGAMLHEVLFGTLVARSMLGKPITDEWIENVVASVWQGFGTDQPESESETGSAPGRRGRRD